MLRQNRNLLIVSLIALVNMLGYGIIIPILYAYSKKFGLSDFQNGLLFASYSVCQFLSTPLIGRLSDKYGRRPLLLVSITGTAISFFMMAFASNAILLFCARALDGLTAGNIPVAFAVLSDSTTPEERPKAFGIISAAFNFGFIFGPAIAALTVGIGQSMPFVIAGMITLLAVLITAVYLPETNQHLGEVQQKKLFDFKKLWHTLFDENVGMTLVVSLIFFFAFSCAIIYGYQPFTLNVLHLSPTQNAILFTLFGLIGLISQTFLVGRFTKSIGINKSFTTALAATGISFFLMFLSRNLYFFMVASVILGIFNSFVQTLIPTILSQKTDAKSQGSILGLNTSYQSLGMIVGPILGGIVATYWIPLPFLVGSIFIGICFILSFKILRQGLQPESAF